MQPNTQLQHVGRLVPAAVNCEPLRPHSIANTCGPHPVQPPPPSRAAPPLPRPPQPPPQLGGGQGPKPSPAFTAGVSFLDDLAHILEMGAALNAPEVPALEALQAKLFSQFNAAWAHNFSYYGSSPTDGAQTAQAAALALGVVPPVAVPAVTAYLVKDIAAHSGHLSVGIIGQKYLTRALTATGNAWLAANISMQTDYPSFGWTFNHPEEPATTLWELWDGPAEGPGMNSRNHIMQGA